MTKIAAAATVLGTLAASLGACDRAAASESGSTPPVADGADVAPAGSGATDVSAPAASGAGTVAASDAAGMETVVEGPANAPGGTNGGDEGGSAASAGEAEASAAAASTGPGPLPTPLFSDSGGKCGGAAGVGDKVRGFKLPSTTGKTIAPAYYKGRVVLLNFWGTWCKPCLKELPQFSRLYRRYRKHGLTLVAVATDEDRDAVADVIAQKKISAKVAYGGEEVAGAYGDRNFPFTFVVDAGGTIRAAYDGFEEGCMGALEREIRRQLERRNGGS